MELLHQLTKAKQKRYLILSAGGPQSGIQGLYISRETDSWSLLSHAFVPYPAHIQTLWESVMPGAGACITVETLGRLDQAVSLLFLECAKTVCSTAQKSLQQPHAIVLNKPEMWKGAPIDPGQLRNWNLEIGNSWLLASYFKTPVISDFLFHDILGGGWGELPLFPGMCDILTDEEGIAAHLTIGMLSRFFIFDKTARHSIFDTDIGPGTILINAAAKNAQSAEGFDRDGSLSARGKVDGPCLELLASHPDFSAPAPRRFPHAQLYKLADTPCLERLSPLDRLATLTALTARTIFDFYKNEYKHVIAPQTLWVSGGGANNVTLFEFLKTYFAPLKLRRIDEIGIPGEMFVPLALGLSVDACIMGRSGPWKSGSASELPSIGTWFFP